MAYSIQGHISYILEANSERPTGENKKRKEKRSKVMLKKLKGLSFFFYNKNIS